MLSAVRPSRAAKDILMTSSKERRLLAVMFTDVEGYTALMQRDEEAALIVRRRHRQVLEAAVSAHGGELFQYLGDGGVTMFPSVVDAVHAAIEVQDGLGREPVVPLRIGIHQGDISYDTQGAYGDSMNVASRIQSLAAGGSILISAKAHDEIKNQPDIVTTSLGEFELKGVQEPVIAHAVIAEGLAVPTTAEILAQVAGPGAEQDRHATFPYKLLELLGEGGMGEVWLAEQSKPVKRLVALKKPA